MWALARPLAALRVAPTAVTVTGVVLAGGAVAVASGHPVAALALVLLAALSDGLDGAVAVRTDRGGRVGVAADAVADRLADLAFAAVLWRCGAPWGLALAAGLLAVGVDLTRRGLLVPAVITVGERPSWTICAALACAAGAVTSAGWPVLTCAAVWIGLALIAAAQLTRSRPRCGPG